MKAHLSPLTGICLALLWSCGPTRSSPPGSTVAGGAPLASPAGGASPAAGSAGTVAGGSLDNGGVAGVVLGGGGGGGGGGGAADSAAGASGSAGAEPVLATQVVTSAQGSLWQLGMLTEAASGSADIVVNDTTTYQTFDGFGGTFNEKSWSYLALLSEGDRAKALNLLFGAEGAHFTFGRVPIGASEFALDRYSLDITASETTPDLQMNEFSIERDRKSLIPFIKAALALKPDIRFLAVPWTPPVWMKTGGAASGYDGGNMRNDDATLQAYALYLSRFVQAYASQEITIEAIAAQREPSFGESFPSCMWSTPLYLKFVQSYLRPTFAVQGVNANVYLGLMENGEESSVDTAIVSAVKANPEALKSFDGFGFEWGMIKQIAKVTPMNLPIIQTEHQPGNFPWVSPFHSDKPPNDFAYAVESWGLIRDWLAAGATAYIVKHMVLDSVGLGLDSSRRWPQNSLLVIDTEAKTLAVTPAFYVFDHFSHFIVPGAKRISVTSTNLDALAFKNADGSIVTVIYNSDTTSKPTTIAVGGSSLRFTIPGAGFATVFKRP